MSRRKSAGPESLTVGRVCVQALTAAVVASDHVPAASGRMWPGVPPSATAAPIDAALDGRRLVEDRIQEVGNRIFGGGRRRDERKRQRAREDVLSVHQILGKSVAI